MKKTNQELLQEFLDKGGTVKKLVKGDYTPTAWNEKPASNRKYWDTIRHKPIPSLFDGREVDIDNDNE